MAITLEEKKILRALAEEYIRCAEDPVNEIRARRARNVNNLIPDRPCVWIFEEPWHELNVDNQLTLLCEDPFARGMERFFRQNLLEWKYFQGSMVLENFYRIGKSYSSTGYGISVQENTRAIDQANSIISHEYIDQMDTEEALEKLRLPVLTAYPDKDAENVALAEEILDGIMPVRLTGNYLYCSIWDHISSLRGVQPMLMDLALRPEFMHKTMRIFTDIFTSTAEQMDKLKLFDSNLPQLHCTPARVDDLDRLAEENGNGGMNACWFRGLAQPFSSVSPDMHEEFEVEYIRPLAERFGLSYYGCCEPLHDRLGPIMKIKNMRKLGCTPWADVNSMAEQIGGKFVLSRKPNPALVAGTLDEDAIRADIRETAEACIRNNTPCEFVLKDISTVSYKIENLSRWAQIANEVLDEYYDK